ncbi:NAD(P)-binding protein [Auricularia subglabra TFB-10046 SS5]|nr:NAD(P)-binding protein [Auricularia subglabra TFB-10046 SS5]
MAPTVIITGASRGLGLATAECLLADGANVVTVQRTITPELTALAEKHSAVLRNVQGDWQATIKRAVREALETFGSIDAVVFNAAAGAYSVAHVDKIALEDWQRTFDVNVFGVVRLLQEALPILKGGSRIVFVSSDAAERSLFGVAPYSASKAALNSINRTVAAEHPNQICVAIHPGSVRSEASQGISKSTSSTKGGAPWHQMQREFTSKGKGFVPETVLAKLFENVLEPEVPGRVIASLALRVPASLSGKYLHWNDPALEGIFPLPW